MTKRILVVLDAGDDTSVALDTAIQIARRHDGEVTCVALVDTGSIESDTAGGGIGSMYFAEKLRTELKDKTRTRAQELLQRFAARLDEAGVRHSRDHVSEGERVQALVDDMRTHDLLIAGRESHFYYAEPERRTHTLAKVLEQAAAATLVVGAEPRPVEKVVVAYDGGAAAARALQRFAHLSAFGTSVAVELVHLRDDTNEARLESEQMLASAKAYLDAWGYGTVVPTSLTGGSPSERIAEHARAQGADLIVAGAYSKGGIKRLFFGTTAVRLLDASDIPLFLYH